MDHADAVLERAKALAPNGILTQSVLEKAAHDMVLETHKRAKLGVDGLLCLLAAPIGYATFFGVAATISHNAHKGSKEVKEYGVNLYGEGFALFGALTWPAATVTSLILAVVLSLILRHHPPLKKRGGLRALCLLVPALSPALLWKIMF